MRYSISKKRGLRFCDRRRPHRGNGIGHAQRSRQREIAIRLAPSSLDISRLARDARSRLGLTTPVRRGRECTRERDLASTRLEDRARSTCTRRPRFSFRRAASTGASHLLWTHPRSTVYFSRTALGFALVLRALSASMASSTDRARLCLPLATKKAFACSRPCGRSVLCASATGRLL